ncbi:class I SAM-dependent methyltransferase [Ruania halotolerans]|uniref:class I SAM-dependent methyltransferase n=1 Tax=Ruania halotolerans TaxID=2897773 RepID=UPI001E3D5E63|nr:class I SAM-dependent methyltransferase [Ruania halotolerans]UFU05676.1 class I SAM-dependent methyltransferase [Ruania halotolerans]
MSMQSTAVGTSDEPAAFDAERAAAFADRFVGSLDAAALVLMVSLGNRTGLLDTLADQNAPVTSTELARAAALDERYVREWLGGMVVGGIVAFDPADRTYRLPAEHAASLTSGAGVDDLSLFTRYMSLMGTIEPEIARVFRAGGGLGYEAYDTFQEIQRDETARVYDAVLVSGILPLAVSLVERLEAGVDVLDVGTGAGRAVTVMARAFPKSRFTGQDISTEGIGLARAEAEAWGLENAAFEIGDAAQISGRYDVVTAFDTIHDQARPAAVLAAIRGVLADDGVFLMGDIDLSSHLEENVGAPMAPLAFAFSVFHCMTVSLAYGGAGLGTAWGRQRAQEMLDGAGFGRVEVTKLDDDPLNVYYVARP